MIDSAHHRETGSPGSAGVAETDITPYFPVELIGGYRPDPRSRDVLHPLLAQVLVLDVPGTRVCLVSIDSLGLTVELDAQLRTEIAREAATEPSSVMISYTHTHSAPAPLAQLGGARYRSLLADRLAACTRAAVRNLRPCTAGWALGKAGIAENRRAGSDVVDDRLAALVVADSDGPIALVVRAAAHANILMTSKDISSDYVGLARREIAENRGCPVLFVQGAAGNLTPVGVDAIRGGDVADAESVAHRLAERVRRLRFEPRALTSLRMEHRPIELTADVPAAEESLRIAEQARDQAGMEGAGWLAECARLRDAGITTQVKVRDLCALRVNEGCLLGLPDELFCEIALQAATEAGSDLLLLNGYTGGCTGYLATREERAKGGYEPVFSYLAFYPFHGQVASFRPDSADRVVRQAASLWRQVMGDERRAGQRSGELPTRPKSLGADAAEVTGRA